VNRIVISGASRGLGRALALRLAAEHEVITFARGNPENADEFRAASIRHIPGVDLADPASLDELTPLLAEADGLVNNAAIAHDGLLATQSLESLTEVLGVNLIGTLYLTKLYLRSRLARRLTGNIVTISSVASIRGFSGLSVYGASKAALDSMTRSLAREMGHKGFRINAVLPGHFDSRLSSGLDAEQRNQIIRRTPLGRLADTDDIVPVVEFLLSEESRFVTGQCIVVDGGLTA
jgi:3-oxoacyl-[acyl-carrier protein] reductase